MKLPISLWIFEIGAMVTNLIALTIFFLIFIMPAQAFSFFIPFISTAVIFLLLIIISGLGVFFFKGWGYYIFVITTFIMNLFLAFCLLVIPGINIMEIAFLACFMVYFLKPSTRRLFNR